MTAEATTLNGRIFQRISRQPERSISFAEFMELALYDSEGGYYADPRRAVGRVGGDFYTSVSVGDTFGLLLAEAAAEEWRKMDRPKEFFLVEQGAHDGQLAIDILHGTSQMPDDGKGGILFAQALRYRIVEPNPRRRELLRGRLSEAHPDQAIGVAESVALLDCYGAGSGIFLCNELVDAFPVHLVRWSGGPDDGQGKWCERCVAATVGAGEFCWTDRPIRAGSPLAAELVRIDTSEFPDGYTTEINLRMRDWLREVAGLFAQGRGKGRGQWWIFDYGHREAEYFAPERRVGTLRCYRDHRATNDPLVGVGSTDITAHVDFTRLMQWAEHAGLSATSTDDDHSRGLFDQHDFLTRAAIDWLRRIERTTLGGTPMSPIDQARVRQFQTLTHPGMMGRVFKVLVLGS